MDIYNESVRRRFANPQYAGGLQESFEQTLNAEVSASGKGPRIAMAAGLRNGRIAAIRFRAWGCPHLIAAADRACEALQGEPVEALENPDLPGITEELSLPTAKAGLILLLEDALAALRAQNAGDAN